MLLRQPRQIRSRQLRNLDMFPMVTGGISWWDTEHPASKANTENTVDLPGHESPLKTQHAITVTLLSVQNRWKPLGDCIYLTRVYNPCLFVYAARLPLLYWEECCLVHYYNTFTRSTSYLDGIWFAAGIQR